MLPKRVIIEKEGNTTHVIDCKTEEVIYGLKSVKIDMSDGKDLIARITFDVPIEDIVIVDEQMTLPGMNKVEEETPPGLDPEEWESMSPEGVDDPNIVEADFVETRLLAASNE